MALVVLDTDADADTVAVRIAVSVRAVLDTVAVTLGVRDILEEADAVAETVDDGEIRADPDDVTVRLEAVAVIEGVRREEIVGPGEAVKGAEGRMLPVPEPLVVRDRTAELEAEGQPDDV